VTGRLAQSLGGVRVVKAYVAEDREQQIFSAGVYRLFETSPKITGISATPPGHRHRRVVGVMIVVEDGRSCRAR